VSTADNYIRVVRVVSALLYSFDPEGMGASAFAPVDEYDGLASRLVSQSQGLKDVAGLLSEHYPEAPAQLVEAVTAAIELFHDNRPNSN